ncbi:hypothetical protein KBY27_21950 [Ruegeria pomeroyi]|uniref:Uncharacterized protein n=1 Tax=Ruegeria pomeroyi TaxID=89184 RepID=A0A9Q3ZPG2_9RHOB|nr:hypothetical protein [Ruegeria pomeroyi]MCE8540135.1 hypothetical protein [Ruegeria pomeroyi]
MQSYAAARNLFSFLGFCAWCLILAGGGLAFVSGSTVAEMTRYGQMNELKVVMALIPGLGISLVGLLCLALVQIGRASVDSAEYGQQALKVARDQLEVSRQALHMNGAAPQSFASRPNGQDGQERSWSFDTAQPEQERHTKVPELITENELMQLDENGFRRLENKANQLEYRGHVFTLNNGKYDLAGQTFYSAKALKNYLNILEPNE